MLQSKMLLCLYSLMVPIALLGCVMSQPSATTPAGIGAETARAISGDADVDADVDIAGDTARVLEAEVEAAEMAEASADPALSTAFVPMFPECIVPANPGDGSDFACRSVAEALNGLGLVDEEIRVTNMAGAGGRIAFSMAGDSRRDDDNLIIAASPATSLHLAQGRYEPLTSEDVRWLGVIGVDYGVVAVSSDSSLNDLNELVEMVMVEPDSVRFGGGGPLGSQDHMKLGLLLKESGVEPSELVYTPFEGGGDAIRALGMGYIDVFPGNLSEVRAGVESGDLRVLAILTPERVGVLPETPTAIEQGFDTQWVLFRGFYAPGGMSDEAFAWWSTLLEEMAGTPEWAETRNAVGMDEFFMSGEEFGEMVQQQVEDFAELSSTLKLMPGG